MAARSHQQPAAGRRREWHRDLKFWVVAAARALIGLGPAAVENVFAARVALQIAGSGGENAAVTRFDGDVAYMPSGTAADRLRRFERRKKIVREEWIELRPRPQ